MLRVGRGGGGERMSDFTTGSVRVHMLRMAAATLVALAVQMLYSVIDLYWVSRLGKEAVAAVGICSILQMAVISLSQMLRVGITSVISHAAGRRDSKAVAHHFWQSLVCSLSVAGAFGVIVWVSRHAFVSALGADAETRRLSELFLLWFIPALALQFPMAALGASLRGTGDARTMMQAQLVSIGLNIVLAPVLIFGWPASGGLGIVGASLATFVSVLLGNVLLLRVLGRGHRFAPGARDWKPDLAFWRRLLRIGLPPGAEAAILALYAGFVTAVIEPFGASAQAAFGIGARLFQAGLVAPLAISMAAGAVAGQNLGARLPTRVRETFRESLLACMVCVVPFFLLFVLTPNVLMGVFSGDDHVVSMGAEYLRIISWNLLLTGPVFACFGVFTALGNTTPSLVGSAARVIFMAVPVWFLSQRTGFQMRWIWLFSTWGMVLTLLINLWALSRVFRSLGSNSARIQLSA